MPWVTPGDLVYVLCADVGGRIQRGVYTHINSHGNVLISLMLLTADGAQSLSCGVDHLVKKVVKVY